MPTPSIRKTKTATGATAVQVVRYEQRKVVVLKHIGSAHTERETLILIESARFWIEKEWPQRSLFSQSNHLLHLDHARFVGVRFAFAYEFLHRLIKICGFANFGSQLLLDLVIMRVFEPCSKLQSLVLLKRYFGIEHTVRTLYRTLPRFASLKEKAERASIALATEKLGASLAFVLYDVTTLYFESFTSDELRKPGFSKDNKANQPQVVVGLLVTTAGFPLGYEVFAGNTFEGHTMIPVIKAFQAAHNVERLTVVADAAMLSQANITELAEAGFSYIVGARMANLPALTIVAIAEDLKQVNGKTLRLSAKHGNLISEFSAIRFRKDQREMEKQIAKAASLVKRKETGKRAKFVAIAKKDGQYILNQGLIEKTKQLLGVKGYYTNLPASALSNNAIISQYHNLWQVEHSFRMAKSDLATRPIFHYKKEAVQAHLLICFVALAIGKYLEIATGLSLKRIVDIIRSVTDASIVDGLTRQTIVLRSELSEEVKKLINKFKMSY